jgi:uncharacterized protein RhaS with RHS repeats
VKLGSYSFTPSSGHKVELLGANDGRVVADGIRLVSAGAQAANIAYIHTDHLGSPQKMTDTAQTLTWDAQFDPFGEEYLISGSAVQLARFPGNTPMRRRVTATTTSGTTSRRLPVHESDPIS